MSNLPWWLSLLVRILFVDLIIALFVAGRSLMMEDFGMVSLSNRFFIGGADRHPDRGAVGATRLI